MFRKVIAPLAVASAMVLTSAATCGGDSSGPQQPLPTGTAVPAQASPCPSEYTWDACYGKSPAPAQGGGVPSAGPDNQPVATPPGVTLFDPEAPYNCRIYLDSASGIPNGVITTALPARFPAVTHYQIFTYCLPGMYRVWGEVRGIDNHDVPFGPATGPQYQLLGSVITFTDYQCAHGTE